MPRTARLAPGGMIFHVLNRGMGRMRLFLRDEDFAAFERMIAQTLESRPMRILSDCLMSKHWHLLLWAWNLRFAHAAGRTTNTPAIRPPV